MAEKKLELEEYGITPTPGTETITNIFGLAKGLADRTQKYIARRLPPEGLTLHFGGITTGNLKPDPSGKFVTATYYLGFDKHTEILELDKIDLDLKKMVGHIQKSIDMWKDKQVDPAKKAEREKRFREKSKLPEPLKWIPSAINFLDDVQDLLYTGLYLGKPLLRRLPGGWGKVIGWGVILSDLLNAGTNLLATASTPGIKKVGMHRNIKGIKTSIKDPKAAAQEFLKKGGWRKHTGAVLQGAQVARTVTGRGLMLGHIFGGLSDHIWGNIREKYDKFKKKTGIDIFAVPASSVSDNLSIDESPEWSVAKYSLKDKAARVLLQSPQFVNISPALEADEIMQVVSAINMAVGMFKDADIDSYDDRTNYLWDKPIPAFTPTSRSSVEALIRAGYKNLSSARPAYEMNGRWPTFQDVFYEGIGKVEEHEATLRSHVDDVDLWQFPYAQYAEAGQDIITSVTGMTEDDLFEPDLTFKSIAEFADMNIRPEHELNQDESWQLILMAMRSAEVEGREIPIESDWQFSAEKNNLRLLPKT